MILSIYSIVFFFTIRNLVNFLSNCIENTVNLQFLNCFQKHNCHKFLLEDIIGMIVNDRI